MPGNMCNPLSLISTLEMFMHLSKKLIKELEILKFPQNQIYMNDSYSYI